MQNSNYSDRSSSVSSSVSNQRRSVNNLKSPSSSEFEYLGRLVTRERPVIQKSNSTHQDHVIPRNQHKHHYSMGSHRRRVYEDQPAPSEEDEADELESLSKPLGVIRISDRHFREIYRLPTPPPKIKRVYHRLRSPEPKVIERVFVQRPRPQVIENVIEVPPEKVRIINREKYLDKQTPITRSKLVHLKSRRQQRREQEEVEQRTYTPIEQYSQQQTTTIPYYTSQQEQPTTIPYTTSQPTTVPLTTPQQTTLVYPPQSNLPAVGYIQSTIPPNVMFSSQQPLQMPAQQIIQPTSYAYQSQQVIQPPSYPYQPQQTIPNYPFG